MVVVDASALAKYLLKEPGWRDVGQRLAEERAVTIDLVLEEVLNAVWKAVRVHRLLDRSVALEKYAVLVELVEAGVPEVEDEVKYLERALEIALDLGATLYDALHLAQALARKVGLPTSGAGQAEAARRLGVEAITV